MAITLFKIVEKMELKKVYKKLIIKPIIESIHDSQGNRIKLKTTMENITYADNHVRGAIKQDYIDEWNDRSGKKIITIKVRITDFTFYGEKLHLLIHSSHASASKSAILLSKIIFANKNDPILTRMINFDKLSKFLINHDCTIIGCSWIDLNLPNLDKTHVAGISVDKSTDFKRYDNHGVRNSVFFSLPSKNITLSLTRNATISIRTKMDRDDQENFIMKNLVTLCT